MRYSISLQKQSLRAKSAGNDGLPANGVSPRLLRRRLRYAALRLAGVSLLPAGTDEQPPEIVPPVEDIGLHFGESPVDLAADPALDEGNGLRWTSGVLVLTSVLLIAFNSFAIDKWAKELPISETSARVKMAADGLHGTLHALHLDAPLETGRSAWRWAMALRWPSDDAELSAEGGKAPAHASR